MSRVKILRASAGSGKTYRLAYEYIKAVVREPHAYSSILAVTFTNKATEEMKSRILAELNTLARGGESSYADELRKSLGFTEDQIIQNAARARSLILHDYSHFAISTIDKFFQKIIRGFIKELGLDFGYTVELSNDAYLNEAVDRLIERTSSDSTLAMLTGRVLGANLENARNWDIRPELIKIAGEITKERYVASVASPDGLIEQYEAIAERVVRKQKALGEEADRIIGTMERNGLQPTDFNGGSRSFAMIFVKLGKGDPIAKIERLHEVAENSEAWYAKTSKRKEDIIAIVPQLMEQTKRVIELYDDYIVEQNSFDLLSENFNRTLLLNHISEELQKLWAERNRLPIHQTTKLIGRLVNNTAAPFIYEKTGNRFSRYLIDEFQDTSTGQWSNFVPLLDDAIASSDDESVMLIGDVKQAIYRWRGGDWDILARGATTHYGDDADTDEQLRINWRSLPEVVNFNNSLIRGVVNISDNETLKAVYEDFEQQFPDHKTGGYVRIEGVGREKLEETILETVADALSRGYRQRDIALLVREKKHGREAAEILLRGGYAIIDQESLQLVNSEAVGQIVALLKYAFNRADTVSLAKYNRFAKRELTATFENTELLDSLLQQTPIEALNTIITDLALGEQSDQFTYLQAFYQVVMDYCNENVPDLMAFVEWWDENGRKKNVYLPSSGDAITILTIHKSKGLQYPCVIIPHCDWENEPLPRGRKYTTIWANTAEESFAPFNPTPMTYKTAMSESYYLTDYHHERIYSLVDSVNLLYVAVTRAESELHVFYKTTEKIDKKTGEITDSVPENSISNLIIAAGFGEVEVGVKGRCEPKSTDADASEHIFFDKFTVGQSSQRIRTSWDSQRYYEDGTLIETPISYGVMMHRVFSQIAVEEDVEKVITGMVLSGDLTEKTSHELRDRILKALENPLIASWFAPHWKLYNENAIILPGTSSIKRPDRVVTDKERAVVVDYKFGTVKKSSYISQIQGYKSLLAEMGYTDVTGYVWYVELDEIEEV